MTKKPIVTNELIANLIPCSYRHENYLKFYKGKSFTPNQFMGLKNITHKDKLWVAFRLIPKDNLKLAAVDIAELVLPLFETKYPNCKRPRLAIQAARVGSATASDAAYCASQAATGCADYSAYSAAMAAYCAAYTAVYSADSADAAYFEADCAAYTAVYSAADYAAKASGTEDNKKQIRKIILKYWK